jgi:dTDP-4-dehydrorhamnose reductase
MHIFLTGVTGLLGSAFARAAKRRGHTITAVVHTAPLPVGVSVDRIIEGDLTDHKGVLREVLDVFPQALVNTAAISAPADCEANPENAQALNVGLPAQLAQLAHHLSAPLVHVSTDMVFDGERGNYAPTDAPAPANLYGWQKLEAEKAVVKAAPDFATVLRLTLLNGNTPGGRRSVHESLFASWARGEVPKLYTDEIRQPCLADNAAEVLVELCERDGFAGIRHWAGAERLSRWEIGRRILKHFNLPADLIEPVSRRDSPEGRKRPPDLTLDITTLRSKLKTRPQSFDEQLDPLVVPPPARDWYHSL